MAPFRLLLLLCLGGVLLGLAERLLHRARLLVVGGQEGGRWGWAASETWEEEKASP
jgi:hypothetical protein